MAELPEDQLARLERELAHFRSEAERLKRELKKCLEEANRPLEMSGEKPVEGVDAL
jgi:predicted RNase H-like nuclease (RuvC/YqgF family)